MVRFPALVALTLPIAFAQTNRYNYDESKIPAYTIPDPLTLADGAKVKDAKTWNQTRRPELMALFENSAINIEYMYAFPFGRQGRAVLIFRFDQPDAAIERLQAAGIDVVDSVDVYNKIS